jgi:type II secretory pathway pseudopilin PulG
MDPSRLIRRPGVPIRRSQAGMTILETMIAAVVLLVGVFGVMSLFSVAVVQNSNQGELATRATEYAQDKMEALMSLNFTDTTTDTRTYPFGTSGTGLSVGGSTSSAVTGYVDYLNAQGVQSTSSTGAVYERMWQIALDATGYYKTITVKTVATSAPGGTFAPVSTMLVCYKVNLQ